MREQSIGELRYLIKDPKNYTDGKRYPVLLFLHGAGTRGEDINLLKNNPFFQITEKMDLPFVVVAPQCNADSWFDIFNDLIALLKEVANLPFADRNRVYAMGASMGGYAVWQIAMSCPRMFAAVVPICGGGMYWNAGRLKSVPIWAFHGDSDPTVYLEESRKMVDAVNRCGGNARLTIYENCGHDAWSETYSNKEVFDWLLQHRSAHTDKPLDKFNNSELYG